MVTDLQYLGTVLLGKADHSWTGTELQAMLDREGNVYLAAASAYEALAGEAMFAFRAGDTSVDMKGLAADYRALAKQMRETYHTEHPSAAAIGTGWYQGEWRGTDAGQEFMDEDYNAPSW
jgi:hypothetical protein